MSGYRDKADVENVSAERLLLTHPGHTGGTNTIKLMSRMTACQRAIQPHRQPDVTQPVDQVPGIHEPLVEGYVLE